MWADPSGRRPDPGHPNRRRAPVHVLMLVLGALAAALFGLLAVDMFSFAYAQIGISPGWMVTALVGCILGSRIDVPVLRLRRRPRDQDAPQRVTVAVNVGGALIPVTVATYLLVHGHVAGPASIAVVVVTASVFLVARPVPGVGVVVPSLLPALVAAATAMVIGGPAVAAVAYTAGTLGTLLGGDILTLPKVSSLGASKVSIGGAGTFDGVFLTGIIAVILAVV